MERLARHELSLSRAPRAVAERNVRYLEAWMEDHLADPISIDDLAAAVKLAPRSVQYAFRRTRGCTPMQALIGRRLDRDHLALVVAGLPGLIGQLLAAQAEAVGVLARDPELLRDQLRTLELGLEGVVLDVARRDRRASRRPDR